VAEAIEQFRKALEINPHLAVAHNNLGLALQSQGHDAEAVDQYRKAVEVNPCFARAHFNLARALVRLGRTDEAVAECRATLELESNLPNLPEVYRNAARILGSCGQIDDAVALLRRVLETEPGAVDAHYSLGRLLSEHGRTVEATAEWKRLSSLQPENATRMNELAWVLATAPEASARNGARAVELAKDAVKLSGGQEPAILDTLAAAQAEAGQFSEAVETAERALALASSQNNAALADGCRARIKLYEAGTAFHEVRPPPTDHP